MVETSGHRWLRPVLRALAPVIGELILLSLFVNLLALAVPIFVMQVYDRVVFHAGFSTLYGLGFGIACVLAFDWILRTARARILQRVALRIDATVGRDLFDKLLSLPLSALEDRPTAYWHALFRDVEVIRNAFSGTAALMIFDVPFAVFFLALTFFIAEPIAWLLAFFVPMFVLLAWRSARSMTKHGGAERRSGLGRDTLIAEIIAGRTTIKALALDQALRPVWEERHAECIERAVDRGADADRYANAGTTLTMACTAAMTGFGALAIIEQQMTIGGLIAASMLSGRLMSVLSQLVGNWRVYATAIQSARRLSEIFSSESERRHSVVRLDRPKGVVALEAVTFTYAGTSRSSIESVSLTLKPGGICGVLGHNGSGKSTLLKLMQGLYRPARGRVLLDGADIVQFTRAELAEWIGYVPQECALLTGSIRDNIAQRRPEASDSEVTQAATLAGIHGMVVDLPDGYATDIGEGGRRLSAGQRQRIAIARALVGDPAVLLLDEPSSGLDHQAESALRDMLVEWARTRTVVVVTHSQSLLTACRTLVHLQRGRILLEGPREEVMPQLVPERSRQARPVAVALTGVSGTTREGSR